MRSEDRTCHHAQKSLPKCYGGSMRPWVSKLWLSLSCLEGPILNLSEAVYPVEDLGLGGLTLGCIQTPCFPF